MLMMIMIMMVIIMMMIMKPCISLSSNNLWRLDLEAIVVAFFANDDDSDHDNNNIDKDDDDYDNDDNTFGILCNFPSFTWW